MRILGMLKADKESEAGAPPSRELMERMGTFIEEITKAGVMLATDGLQPSFARSMRPLTSPPRCSHPSRPPRKTRYVSRCVAMRRRRSMRCEFAGCQLAPAEWRCCDR